jgi:Ca2+-binding EF-hand superfamily protein
MKNFNAAGKWREKDGKGRRVHRIDSSGAFHNGPTFTDFFELREWIATNYQEDFARGFTESDVNSDGVLSKQEFVTFLGSTAHLDTFFKKADKDRSGDISVEEVAGYIDSILR